MDIENNDHEYKNIKKKYILIITDVKNHNDNIDKKGVEHYSRVQRKLAQVGMNNDNIIVNPRIRKQRIIHDV